MVKYKSLVTIIEDYINKCHRSSPKRSSGLISIKENRPQFKPLNKLDSSFFLKEDELKEIGNVMAERYGLIVSKVDEDNFVLYDKENETLLNFSEHINYPMVDFTNRDKADYNLDDLLFYYDSMPDIMKKSVDRIRFSLEEGGACYYTSDGFMSEVVMTNEAVTHDKESYYNAQLVLYHECGHALDDYLNNNKNIGDSNNYRMYMDENNEKFASEYSKTHYLENLNKREDFAETVAMVCFDRMEDKSNAIMVQDSNVLPWKREDFGTFQQNHKSTFKFVKDLLGGKVSADDLTYN